MKLAGTVSVRVKGEDILRKPRFWDKLKATFGGTPDLRTGNRKAALEAAAVVDAVRDALRTLGATNAVSLVIDDLVLFQDRDGRPDDLGDLFLAFHEQSDAIGGDFKLLRLAVEHLEAGLHLVIEVQARGEHPDGEAAVRVVIAGRLHDLEPKKGEDAEAYRRRVEPIAKDTGAIDVARMQFESFVGRVRDAIQRAMPEAEAEVVRAEAQIQRPDPKGREPVQPGPTSPHYDPYDSYYPSPLGTMMNVMMWSAIFSMAMPMHHVTVINHEGAPVGTADTPGIEHADPGPAEAGGDFDSGGDAGGDVSVGDGGAEAGGFDSGGDFGGFFE
jgi:hypothetical protein